jgi:hypothetical protein
VFVACCLKQMGRACRLKRIDRSTVVCLVQCTPWYMNHMSKTDPQSIDLVEEVLQRMVARPYTGIPAKTRRLHNSKCRSAPQ